MKALRLGFVFCVLAIPATLAASPQAVSQAPRSGRETSAESVASYALSQKMPVDPEVTVGTLPNGLRYYVRPNAKPPKRASPRWSSSSRTEPALTTSRSSAHFVEHMEFEGTRHFPRQGVIQFLSSLGLGIGPDANAATSYDDT